MCSHVSDTQAAPAPSLVEVLSRSRAAFLLNRLLLHAFAPYANCPVQPEVGDVQRVDLGLAK